MSKVFVVDTNKQPLTLVHPARARKLLGAGKAAVFRHHPFTIILKRGIEDATIAPLRLKLDPGSKTTGIAIVDDASGEVVFAAELEHRGQAIKNALDDRRAIRRNRRNRKTRYRKPRWQNRRRSQRWLPPSLGSRIANILIWVNRLAHLCHVTNMSLELVKFDMQLIEHPEICGVSYQQGTLAGYETREYLLEKWGRRCTYCGKDKVALQVEHIVPRAKGGTDRISNLCLACQKCNIAKGTSDIRDFLAKQPELLKKLLALAKAPLKDAAAVNATRWELWRRLSTFDLPIECGSGGLTKYNRSLRGLPKTHWLDAACVGMTTPERLQVDATRPLLIQAHGHGNRQMCGVEKHGFPKRHRQRKSSHYGFQTGDMVQAIVPSGKYAGQHRGRVLVRATGSFDIKTTHGRVQGISYRHCTVVSRQDGYSYGRGNPTTQAPNKEPLLPPSLKRAGLPQAEEL